jgi:2,3-bisphosphoglycerate-dependent phosphoglycerate mutase
VELYIIRHAQSTNNTLPDMRNRVKDPALTELGYRQAEIVAQHLASGTNLVPLMGATEEDTSVRQRQGYGLTRLYCSAMLRALQTAKPIGEALDLAPQVWVDIHEHGGIFLDHGDEGGLVGYPGQTRTEILAEFPNYILPDEVSEDGWWNKGFEEWPICQGRAIKVASELRHMAREVDENERIAMVSHGGFIDALLKALSNQLPAPHLSYHHYNTAISRIDIYRDGHLALRYLNRVPHLTPELIS